MPEITYKQVKIADICDKCASDKTLTKAKLKNKEKLYPVYAATLNNALCYTDTYNNEETALLVVNDGVNAGKTYIVTDEKYTIGKHVTGLRIKPEYKEEIDLNYVRIIAEPIFIKQNKTQGRGNLPQVDILNSFIPIPIKNSKVFDFDIQKDIANKYYSLKTKKNELLLKRQEIESINISFTEDLNTIDVKITDLFTPTLGNGKYTKEVCLQIKGEYPVYSGNTVGCFSHVNEYNYDGEYLTWAKDGLAGYLMYHNEKFAITNHRGILIPTKKCVDVDLNYIKIVLEPIFRKHIKGRLGVEGKNEYTTLSKDMIKKIEETIPIPIKSDGTFNLEKQQEIAKKYKVVENIKTSLSEKITELVDIEVVF